MAPKKSSSSAGNKKKTSASKKAKSTADIQKKAAPKVPINTFTIKQLDTTPTVEPLMDDVEALEQEIEQLQGGRVQFGAGAEDESDDKLDISYEPMRKPAMRVAALSDLDEVDSMDDVSGNARVSNLEDIPPKDIIKVRFGTFVNLVTNHDMDEVVAENAEKEIIMEANLLTELASSRDQREERKVPLVFLVGIAIGVVLTYIFFST